MATRTQTAKRTPKTRSKGAYAHRIQRLHRDAPGQLPQRNATLDCGWGRLLFGQTFDDPGQLAAALIEEDLGPLLKAPSTRTIDVHATS